MNWYSIFKLAGKFDLNFLINEAKKHSSFEDFKNAYLRQLHHGLYWHITSDPNFEIDLNIAPRDRSSLGTDSTSKGLMITSHLEHWNYYYNFDEDEEPLETLPRPYAALIDLSNVNPSEYSQISRGFGNEMFLHPNSASKAKIVGVYPINEALKIDKEYNDLLPSNEVELKKIYELSHDEGGDEDVKISANVIPISEDSYDFDEDEDLYQGLEFYDIYDQAEKLFQKSKIRPDSSKNLSYVAIENGEIAGAVYNSWIQNEYSFDLAILPEYRGKGNIFKELMNAAINQYEEDKAIYEMDGSIMKLWVVNPKLVKVLERSYGFVIDDSYPDGSYHMVRY